MTQENSSILIEKTATGVGAVCGGYCNSCKLNGELYLISALAPSTVPTTTSPMTRMVTTTTTTTGTTLYRDPSIARNHQQDIFNGFMKWMEANIRDEKFKTAMTMKIEQLSRKMLRKSEKIHTRCGSFNREPRKGKHGKYAKQDNCKAANQLTKAFLLWNKLYNVDCRGRGMDNVFPELMQKHFDKILTKLKKKLAICG